MAGYYSPDLTGAAPDYKVEGEYFTLFKTGQKLVFDTPVYEASLTLHTTGLGAALLPKGIDWVVNDDDIDTTAMSKIKNVDLAFDQVLLRSITIIRPLSVALRVELRYQQLYAVTSRSAVNNNELVELTPDLILELLQRVADVETRTASIDDHQADTTARPKLLALDPHGTDPDNQIADEVHTVNVFAKKNILRPIAGSFFRDSVVLRIVENNRLLNEGEDYMVFGCNLGKTKTSDNTSGVYEFILLTYPYAGDVELDYRAYGGEVTLADVSMIHERVNNIAEYLTTTKFLTPGSLVYATPFVHHENRLTALETDMRILQSGNPDYGDTSNGSAVVRRLRAVDANHHWWTIATLYQVDGSPDVITADRMRFRVELTTAAILADVDVALNIALADPMAVSAGAVLQDLGYTLFGAVSGLPVPMPQFRAIWNDDPAGTGVALQIGLSLPTLHEVVGIEDRSGIESGWKLVPSNTVELLPQDTAVLLPDGATLWDPANADSRRAVHMMPCRKEGYLAWAGAQDVTSFAGADPAFALDPHKLPGVFVISDIHEVELLFTDVNDDVTRVTVPLSGLDADHRMGSAPLWVPGTGAALSAVTVRVTRSGPALLAITVHVASAPSDSTLALRYALVKV